MTRKQILINDIADLIVLNFLKENDEPSDPLPPVEEINLHDSIEKQFREIKKGMSKLNFLQVQGPLPLKLHIQAINTAIESIEYRERSEVRDFIYMKIKTYIKKCQKDVSEYTRKLPLKQLMRKVYNEIATSIDEVLGFLDKVVDQNPIAALKYLVILFNICYPNTFSTNIINYLDTVRL